MSDQGSCEKPDNLNMECVQGSVSENDASQQELPLTSPSVKNIVGFDINGVEVPVSDAGTSTSGTEHSVPTASPTSSKKTVHFALGHDKVPKPPSSESVPPVEQQQQPDTMLTTLLKADTTLPTPVDGPPLDFPSTPSQTSSPITNSHTTSSSLSTTDVRQWTKTGTFGTIPLLSPLLRISINGRDSESDNTNTQMPAFEQSSVGVGVLVVDEGEKSANGKVITVGKDPCEKCGGKVVWATKGEWLLICEGCQEPQ